MFVIPKTPRLSASQVHSNMGLAYLSNPSIRGLGLFVRPKKLAKSKVYELGSQSSPHDVDLAWLLDPKLLDLMHKQIHSVWTLQDNQVQSTWTCSQPSSHDVGLACLLDSRPVDLADNQVPSVRTW